MSNSKNIITISQEEGSGGREIAQDLARKLNLRLVDEQFIHAAFLKLGIDYGDITNFEEKALPKINELNFTLNSLQDFYLSEVLVPDRANFGYLRQNTVATKPSKLFNKEAVEDIARAGYNKLIDTLIKEFAEQGRVIFLDLGANFTLKNWPQVLNLRIVAPFEDRVERLAYIEKISQAEAESYLRERDQQQTAYVRQYYGPDCANPALYHLVINTANVSLPAVRNAVYRFVQEFETSYNKVDALQVHRSYNRLVDQESYTLEEASHLLWIDQDILRRAVYQGELKGKVIDHKVIRISHQALVDWLRLHKLHSSSEQTN